jgi:hypothetical protein
MQESSRVEGSVFTYGALEVGAKRKEVTDMRTIG